MRIQKLKVANFVSIVKAEIDFTKFDDGVFVISGPTGSGKSSLFDAIHFALYGTPCNHNRNVAKKSLFSTFAKPKDWLDTDLTFEQSGKIYRVVRSMNSSGNTAGKLYLPDGTILDKLKDINSTIEEVINLNGHQFDQMVMLEQNNFSKFLLADSAERGDLLRSVFDTQVFQFIQSYLKNKSSQLLQEVEKIRITESAIAQSYTIDRLKEMLQQDQENLASYEAEKAALEESLEVLRTQAAERKKYESDMVIYQTAQQGLEKLKQQSETIESLKQLSEKAMRLGPARFLAKSRNGVLHDIKASQEQIQTANQELLDLGSIDATSSVDAITHYTQQLSCLYAAKQTEDRIQILKRDIEKLDQKVVDLPYDSEESVEAAYQPRFQWVRAAIEYEKAIEEYQKDVNLHVKKLDELDTKARDLQELEETVETQAINFLKSKADGICPICGQPLTEDHEEPIPEVDLSQYGQAKAAVVKLRQEIEELEARLIAPIPDPILGGDIPSNSSTELTKQLQDLKTEYTKISVEVRLGLKTNAELATERQHHIEEIESLEAVQEQRKDTNPWITDNLEALIREAEDNLAEAKEQQAAIEEKLQKKKYLEGVLEIAQQNLKKSELALEHLKEESAWGDVEEYDACTNSVEEYYANEADIKSRIATYDRSFTSLSAVKKPECSVWTAFDVLSNQIAGKAADSVELTQKISDIRVTSAQRQNAIIQLEDLAKKREALNLQVGAYGYLSKMVNGDNGSKVSLENFVLHRQLEWILQNSNRFLAQLTDNQYQLELSWTAITGRKQGGLDLTVKDTTNGSVRPSQTFSGGELFLLSLSLSLGLMVSINAVFSTVSLEMLFIDEGFGTLDPVTLNRVLNLIHGLQSVNSIGIISHVQDLVDTIPQGLKVEKGLTGSNITQFKH